MNPEEGELRPQLLDRFGLTVEVAAPREPSLRAEVVRRRMAFDRDPAGFVRTYAAQEDELRGRRIAARSRRLLGASSVDDQLTAIAEVCAAFEVDGLRADIVTARAAAAHAAWHGRAVVTTEDIRAAARLALPHRRRRNPFDAPGLDEELLDQLLERAIEPEPDPGGGGGPSTGSAARRLRLGARGRKAQGTTAQAHGGTAAQARGRRAHPKRSEWSRPGQPIGPGSSPPPGSAPARRAGGAGRSPPPGVRSERDPYGHEHGPLHLPATIRAAALGISWAAAANRTALAVRPADLRLAVTEGRESNLVLLVVDASGSMAARRRMEAVKAAALSLLLDAYQRRDKVGLITFRGADGHPGAAAHLVGRSRGPAAGELPSGGRTPLAEGLLAPPKRCGGNASATRGGGPLLVLVTDGRATSGPDAVDPLPAGRGRAARGPGSAPW